MFAVSTKLAANLSRLRKLKGLTQQQVADAIGLQKPGPISEWENGTRRPGPKNLKRLAAFYATEVAEIDPDGEAWDAETPRAERQALQKTHAPTDTEPVAEIRTPPEVGAQMDPGALLTIPDSEEFRKVLAVWLGLDTERERRDFVSYARAYSRTARPARKKVAR